MEFYSLTRLLPLYSVGFNSQRDGILLCGAYAHIYSLQFQFPTGWNSTLSSLPIIAAKILVSIPNGMEFYKKDRKMIGQEYRFNSQRDGILLREYSASFGTIPVSIPNGMEFYLFYIGSDVFLRRFQFPTGWNSTFDYPLSVQRQFSFNSQRDGILHQRREFCKC